MVLFHFVWVEKPACSGQVYLTWGRASSATTIIPHTAIQQLPTQNGREPFLYDRDPDTYRRNPDPETWNFSKRRFSYCIFNRSHITIMSFMIREVSRCLLENAIFSKPFPRKERSPATFIYQAIKSQLSFATVGGASSPNNRGWKPLPQKIIEIPK